MVRQERLHDRADLAAALEPGEVPGPFDQLEAGAGNQCRRLDRGGGGQRVGDTWRRSAGMSSLGRPRSSVAAVVAMTNGELEVGARLAGASAGLAVRAEVANAMILVLHLPDPVMVARERLGDAADALLAEGDALSYDAAIEFATR